MFRVAFLLPLCCLASPAPVFGQLRILSYNVSASGSSASGPRTGMETVLRAVNAQNRPGFSRPIDIMLIQEAESVATTGQAYASLLNSLSSGTAYRASAVDGTSLGSGRPIAVYNSAAVTLISEVGIGVVSSTGQPRQTMRYQFRPAGYDSNADFYVYNSQFNASTGSANEARRAGEAATIRADADALGDGRNIVYAGDLNLSGSAEAAFQSLVAPGGGQAYDPVNQIGAWSGNAAFVAQHTQSPATTAAYAGQATGGLNDRFDFQLVSNEWFDGRGLDYVLGSYWAFGNTATHALNGAVTSGNAGTLQLSLPGYTAAQAGAVLAALSQVAEHLPVVADYRIPARMTASLAGIPATVIKNASVSASLSVSNSAPVSTNQGADRLDYTYQGTGVLAGSGTGWDMALGSTNAHTLTVNTSQVGLASGTVSVASSSLQAASPTFSQAVTVSVLDNSIGSFVQTSTVTGLTIDFGTLTQGTGTASQGVSIFNRAGASGAASTARLDLDTITPSVPGVFATTLSPFTNLGSGSSRAFGVSMLTTTTGSFSGTYSLGLSDENLPGATTQSLSLTVRGRVASPANALLTVASGTQTQLSLGFAGITGTSSITKTGSGTVLLDQVNTFTGTTSIQQGSAAISSTGAISNSSLVSVSAGAALDLLALASGYSVSSGQTLGGGGTVLGSVVFGQGATLSPGMANAAGGAALAAVPEPATWALGAAGLGCLACSAVRRTRVVRSAPGHLPIRRFD